MARSAIVDVRGIDGLVEAYGTLSAGQLQGAVKDTLTQLARGYSAEVSRYIPTTFDNPTPFTRQAASWDRAREIAGQGLASRTYIRPKQEDYLFIQEAGGNRHRGDPLPKGGEALPLQIKDTSIGDRYGNLGPKGIRRRVEQQSARGNRRPGTTPLGTKRLFVAGIKGKGGTQYGLWLRQKISKRERAKETRAARTGNPFKGKRKGPQAPGWKLRLLVAFQEDAAYEPLFHFGDRALAYGRARAGRLCNEAVQRRIQRELDRGRGR